MTKSKFYTFHQNNSGGTFEENEDLAVEVIIEATSAADANMTAKGIGIYFNGCQAEIDCECCGDRWSEVSELYAEDEPCIYGEPVSKYQPLIKSETCYAIVHYMDGRKVRFSK